ncbi:MAG TPA: winged helix-turn-helix domain-containing protein [Blastocatellia bacterium]|nr:winged helix-turn-helix domain-containing protein [Blastocatellia bacterium]
MNGNFRVGEFLIEPEINSITGNGTSTHIEPKVMRVLVCLAEHSSKVVPKEKLIRSVWADTFVTDDVLTRSISELRKVFGDDAREPRFIQTIPRSGYRLVATISYDSEKARAEPQVRGEFSKPLQHRPWWRRVGALITLAVVLTLAVGGTVWYYIAHRTVAPSLPPMKYVSFTSFPGWEGNPAFSPDGNQIAFDWRGDKNDNSDIYVMLIGSEKPLRLTFDPASDYNPTWSPDGRQIAFLRASESEFAIYTVPALGGPERKLLSLGPKVDWGTSGPDLDWSPDGKYFACVEKRSNQQPFNIFLFSPETGERRALTSPAPDLGDFFPAFSPDSQTVAFVRSSSPNSADIYLVSVTGGEPRRLTFDNVPLWGGGLAWTADGREIIFSSTRAGGDYSLWRISASGGTPERSAVGGHYVPDVSISRQGNRLAYVQWSGDINIYRIEVSDSTGSGNVPIKLTPSTRLDFAGEYSPDGKRIVFYSDRSGSNEIWMCDSDGSNAIQVTSLGKLAGTPHWSPDGRQIAFDFYAEGKGDIYVVSAEGGLPRPIVTGDSDDHLPSWSRDGKWIYFSSNRTGVYQVWKVPAEGGVAVQVTRQGGGLAFESPNGKYVCYGKDSAPGVWRVPVDGGEEVQVLNSFKSEDFRDWAVVSDGLYFINPDTKDGVVIQFFDFATRKVKQIAALGKVEVWAGGGIAVSPDRRYILYTQNDHPGGDIMLVENFR